MASPMTFGVFDLGLTETGDTLISPAFPTRAQASNRLRGVFNEYHRLPQVYTVKNLSTGEIVGSVFRNAAARKLQRDRCASGQGAYSHLCPARSLTRALRSCPSSGAIRDGGLVGPACVSGRESMCDYSLMSIPSRLALEGEKLMVHRFSTGAMGLASSADLQTKAAPPGTEPRTF